MPVKKSQGQMYPWVNATHTHLGGECSHKCKYCYVENPRFGRPERYQGSIRLIEKEFNVNYDEKTLTKICEVYPAVIFIENCNDLFAKDVPNEFITRIMTHCCKFPENTYVFQTKNPIRYVSASWTFPKNYILGCTIETNRNIPDIGTAPTPAERAKAMIDITGRKFITIEPVLDFDVEELASWIAAIKPEFLNLGADSKGHGLAEPTVEKVMALVAKLHDYGIELREKHNLQRLKQKE